MNITLIIVSGFFFGMGLTALYRPAWILSLFKTSVTSPEGRNEVRAVDGGYGIAVGAICTSSEQMGHKGQIAKVINSGVD